MQAQKRRLLQQCKDILHGGFVTSAIIENRNLQPIGQAVFQRQCGMGIRFHRRRCIAPGKQQRNKQEKRQQAQKHLIQNGSSQSNMARKSVGKTIIGSSIIAGFSPFFKRRPRQKAADPRHWAESAAIFMIRWIAWPIHPPGCLHRPPRFASCSRVSGEDRAALY